MSSKLTTAYEDAAWPNEYIVRLKSGVEVDLHCTSLPFYEAAAASTASADEDRSRVLVQYDTSCFNGYACKVTRAELDSILERDDVEAVEPNYIARKTAVQRDAPWGLQSISTTVPVLPNGQGDVKQPKYTYTYDEKPGEGVDIYVVDTGIQVEHQDFGGRASWGWAAPGYRQTDGDGHGTHCAGSAAGEHYGVAKAANLIAVKVLGDDGSGSYANVIAGIEYVVRTASNGSRPAVISMSLGGPPSQTLDSAVVAAINRGVTFVVAAGNETDPAETSSPARVQEAITVGAVDIRNRQAGFSNYGYLIDIWAPGVDILSSWIGRSNKETNVISGTSMACPHISGLAAYLLAKQRQTPAQVAATIKGLATKNVLQLTNGNSVNLLAYNGVALRG